MNYSAHFIDWFHDCKANYFERAPSDARKIASLIEYVSRAEKFLMPEGGQIFRDFRALEEFTDLLRLPYPICVLEFSVTPVEGGVSYSEDQAAWATGSRHRELTLVIDASRVQFIPNISTGFIIFSASSQDGKTWCVAPVAAYLDPDRLEVSQLGRAISYTPLPIMGDMLAMIGSSYGAKQGQVDLHSAIQGAVHFMIGVNCTNVKKEAQPPSQKLNAKRKARGRHPFDSYWILDITKEYHQSSAQGGSHASPRLHFRRGHIRRLATGGATWVRHTVVGNPERGVVDKSYRLGETAI